MKNKLIALLIIAGIAGTIAGLCVIPSLVGLSGSVNDWFVHVKATTLVNGSERIVVARFLDEMTYEIPLPPTADSYSAVSVAQLHRRFEVVEPLKGDTRPGDAFHVVWPAGVTVKVANTGDLEFLPYDVILLSAGEIYVLFLNRSSRRSAYSEDSPRTLWELTWGNCSDLWGSTGHQASHRGAAKHGICFASRLVPSNVNSYHLGTRRGADRPWWQTDLRVRPVLPECVA